MRQRSWIVCLLFSLVVLTVVAPGVGMASRNGSIEEGTFDMSQVDWDLSEPALDGGPHRGQ